MSLYGLIASQGPSGFGYASTAEQVTDGLSLAGKTILITGANAGLGAEALRVLAMRGARVLATARTLEKAQVACSGSSEAVPLACELSEPASVRGCVEAVKAQGVRLDAIICNAGVMALPQLELVCGFEKQFFTNHIGHFLLVTGLLEQLDEAGRVVMLSSSVHRQAPKAGIEFDNLNGARGYSPWSAYGQAKLANLLFAKELARRFVGGRKTANAVHPGVIRTSLQRHMNPVLSATLALAGPIALKTVAEGAATEVYVATRPELAGVSGEYFADCNIAKPRADANDPALAQRLWEVSEKIVANLPV
jgi:WW domain-containing oxidoreductase